MMKFKNVIVIAAAVVFAGNGYAFPSYIEKCKRNDPKINECILRSAKKAIPQLMKGDASLQIPDLNAYDPLDQTFNIDGIVYTLKNIKHTSGDLNPTHTSMNFADQSCELGMHLPFLVWKADFSASGTYKGKNIDASGRATISYDDIQFNYTKNFEDKDIEGKTYLQIKSESTVGSIEKISIIHNYGDKATGKDELDSLVPQIKTLLEKRVQEICSQLVTYVMNAMLRSVTKNEVFLS